MNIKPIILQNILDSLPVGLMVIDPEGEVININRAASVSCRFCLQLPNGLAPPIIWRLRGMSMRVQNTWIS